MYDRLKKPAGFTVLLILSLFISFTIPTLAAPEKVENAVTDTASGIFQVILSCTDDNGNTYYLHQGTGFLIGSSEQTQYIITDSQTITPSKAELNQIRKWGGLGSDAKLTPQIQFLLAPDIAINASVVSQGSDLPYALLTPATPISNSKALKLGSISSATRKDTAYLYGYNLEMSLLGLTEISGSAPELRTGSISSVETNPAAISCDIEGETGCAGAPLLDKNGYVLGMFYHTKDNLEVLPADTIQTILKTLNISYRSTDPNSDYNVADDSIKKNLSDLLAECQQDVTANGSEYSDKTLTNYKSAISAAMTVITSPESTKDNYQESIDALTEARKKLKPKNFTMRIVELVFLAIILIFAFINLRQLRKSKNLLCSLHPESFPDTKDNTVSQTPPPASLLRLDTMEVIPLTKPEIRIGKAAEQVDYCILDNSAVSRYHAAIIRKENTYYIIDNHSTNHTSVNHSVISPEHPVALKSGDMVSLANISFQFYFPQQQ